jgi:predicted Zn-dependent peptidase
VREDLPTLTRTEVDGVPTLWVAHGPPRAGLVFRVGRADESLISGGITHLLEHLALHRVGTPEAHFNGATGPAVTMFLAQGSAEDLADFFATVCAGLRQPPAERLEAEKAIIETEAHGRESGPADRLATWRYGPATYGLPTYPEFGLDALTLDDLHNWSATWFTRENAALWLTGGPPPPGLRLDLPAGQPMPAPTPSSALPRLPAYFASELDGVVFDCVVARSVAVRAYSVLLSRRLRTALRQESGLSYQTGAAYTPRDADNATVTAFADALPDKRTQVPGPFVDVLIDLATAEVSDDELASVRREMDGQESNEDRATGLVVANAINLVLGAPLTTLEQLRAEVAALTPRDIRTAARASLETGLIAVPPGQAVGRAGFTQAPAASAGRVVGDEHTLVNRPDNRLRLVVGAAGVSLTDGPIAHTVRFDECVGALAYADGGRTLFAPDAVVVQIEPQLWNIPQSTLANLDRWIPADRIVRLPARPENRRPEPPPAPPPPVPRRWLRTALIYLVIGLMWLAAAAFAVVAITGHHSIFAVIGGGMLASLGTRYLLRKRPS